MLTIGLFTENHHAGAAGLSRSALQTYAQSRLGSDRLQQTTGFPIGFGAERGGQTRPRIIFVGDAAGYAKPISAEGLHFAILSGRLAARSIDETARGLWPDLIAASDLHFYPLRQGLLHLSLRRRLFYRQLPDSLSDFSIFDGAVHDEQDTHKSR